MRLSPNLGLGVFVCVCLGITDQREESQGDVRQRREHEQRNNGVRESTSEEDEKSKQSIQLGVYQLCMASILFFGQGEEGNRLDRKVGVFVCDLIVCVCVLSNVFLYILQSTEALGANTV